MKFQNFAQKKSVAFAKVFRLVFLKIGGSGFLKWGIGGGGSFSGQRRGGFWGKCLVYGESFFWRGGDGLDGGLVFTRL